MEKRPKASHTIPTMLAPYCELWSCCHFHHPRHVVNNLRRRQIPVSSPLILVCRIMYTDGSPARRIEILGPRSVPLHCLGCGACHTGPSRNSKTSRVLWEEPLKDHSVIVTFLGSRGVVREDMCSVEHHFVGHMLLRVSFEPIDPAIPHAIAELFLLPVQNMLWEVGVLFIIKSLSKNPLLHPPLLGFYHLPFRVNVHGNIDELLVQKRDSGF
nr:hypothetical protein Iba_chr12fCG17960 [Ipomoea batatas]